MSSDRVLIFTSSLGNPFVDAWFETFRNARATVLIVTDSPTPKQDSPATLQAHSVAVTDPSFVATVTTALGGEPTLIFYWWGLQRIWRDPFKLLWPNSRRILCIDTFPNASRFVGELKELALSTSSISTMDGFVVTSVAMETMLKRRFMAARTKPFFVIPTPFPLSSHANSMAIGDANSDPRNASRLRLCFSGRTDFLETSSKRMSKDNLGPWLRQFLELGAAVYVQEPSTEAARERLNSFGFHFYPSVPRDRILSGELASTLGQFDGQLVHYNVANPTIRRRVTTGLSTRFATALCAPSPIVVPVESEFADSIVTRYGIGLRSSDPAEIVNRLTVDGAIMRQNWEDNHSEWASEAFSATTSDVMA